MTGDGDVPVRIAMWSGPRNLSTAMMRAFGSRADTAVADEPFYAAFLDATGIDHPMREEILAAHERDPAKVIDRCLGPVPGGRAVFYQKHMTHHMVDCFDLSWTATVRNAFLIRDPEAVAASYEMKREAPTLADLGLERQVDLFMREADRLGHAPPVLDAADVLADPEAILSALCDALQVGFDRAMLSWEPGPRAEDGAWGPHWYGAVYASTSFGPVKSERGLTSDHARRLAEQAAPLYTQLAAHKLTAAAER